MSAYARQLRAAQLAYDHQSPPEPCELSEAVDHDIRNDAAKLAEAASWVSGDMDGTWYDEMTELLHAWHHTNPCDLGPLLPRMYALAKAPAKAMDEWLAREVEAEVQRQIDEAEEARSFAGRDAA